MSGIRDSTEIQQTRRRLYIHYRDEESNNLNELSVPIRSTISRFSQHRSLRGNFRETSVYTGTMRRSNDVARSSDNVPERVEEWDVAAEKAESRPRCDINLCNNRTKFLSLSSAIRWPIDRIRLLLTYFNIVHGENFSLENP